MVALFFMMVVFVGVEYAIYRLFDLERKEGDDFRDISSDGDEDEDREGELVFRVENTNSSENLLA